MGILQGSYIGISQIIAMIHHDTFANIPIQKGSRVDSLGCELKPILCFLSGCATRLAKSKQPLSHSATLPEWLDQPLSHSATLPERLDQPLSHSATQPVAGPATLTRASEWLSG